MMMGTVRERTATYIIRTKTLSLLHSTPRILSRSHESISRNHSVFMSDSGRSINKRPFSWVTFAIVCNATSGAVTARQTITTSFPIGCVVPPSLWTGWGGGEPSSISTYPMRDDFSLWPGTRFVIDAAMPLTNELGGTRNGIDGSRVFARPLSWHKGQ